MTRPARPFRAGLGAVAVLAVACFAYGLPAEPHFVDESAYVSQTYFAAMFARCAWNDPGWLEYPAYDLPPLPKYLIGASLAAGGYRLPGPAAARRWYRNTSSRFVPPGALTAARVPSVLLGAAGCVAIYLLGTFAQDERVGGLAALFLMINPLYRMHARRAMSDVPAEAFILLALAAALWVWRRLLAGRAGVRPWVGAALAGACAGLAALSKLNGALAMFVVLAWAALALAMGRFPIRRRWAVAGTAVVSGVVSLATFLALNPFLTARPSRTYSAEAAVVRRLTVAERFKLLAAHRVTVSTGQMDLFPHNALRSPAEKLKAVLVQGFGRFGPLGPRHSDSTRRYDWSQDWGALIWLPCVLAGAAWAWESGTRQRAAGAPPTAWAILVQAVVALAVVSAYLPLAWDRYFLSLQPGSALLASGFLVAGFERLARAVPSRPEGLRP